MKATFVNTHHCQIAGYQILYFRTLPLCIALTLRWSRTKLGLCLHTWQFEKFRQLLSLESHLLFSLDFPTPVWVKIITWIRQDSQVSHKDKLLKIMFSLIRIAENSWKLTFQPHALNIFWSFSSLSVCSQFGSQPTAQTVFLIWGKWKTLFLSIVPGTMLKNMVQCTCQTQRICQTQEELLHQGTSAVGTVF